jgi:hypothetical protein
VERLIQQLGDPDFRRRDAASHALRDLGPEALPALQKAANHPDPEVRRRLAEIIPDLETARVLSPTPISLTADKMKLKDILDELGRQSGYKFQQWGGNDQQIYSFTLNKVPFWRAVDEVSETCGFVLQQSYGDELVRLQQQEAYVPYVCYDGPFRMAANSLHYYRNLNLGYLPKNGPAQPISEALSLSFTLFSEPKLPLLGIGQPTAVTAYDQDKRSMLPANENAPYSHFVGRYGSGGHRGYCMQATVNLSRPSDRSHTLKYLKGTIPVTLLTQQKPEVVTDQLLRAKGKSFKVGAVTFAIEQITEKPGPRFELKMSITNAEDNQSGNDYSWQNSLYQRIEVQDDKGTKYQGNGNSWSGSGPGFVQLTQQYIPPNNTKAAPPTKLVFHAWTTMVQQVTFEFKDLPLP